jgi:hypothetical protein
VIRRLRDRPFSRALSLGALAVAAALVPDAGWAATVLLVRPRPPSPVATEAIVRLEGELAAGGFNVRVIDPPPAEDVRGALERAADSDAVALVAIMLGSGNDAVELWVIDRVTRKTIVRRVETEPDSAGARAAEVLSVRALELLRASFLEAALDTGRAERASAGGTPPVAEVRRFTEAALDERWRRLLALEVGGSVLDSFEGVGPAFLPVVRLGASLGGRFLLRLTAAGLGTRAEVDSPSGPTELTQQLALLEIGARFRATRRVQPFVSLGGGALRVVAEGRTLGPYQGLRAQQWALAGDLGVGLRLPIRGRFELALEAHALVTRPSPVIRFLDLDLARTGRPIVIGTATLIAWM